MKKIHLIAIIMIIAAIAMLTMAAEDMGTYATFDEAKNYNKKVKVVGQLSLDKPLYYEPQKDPNYFTFYITDAEGVEKKVVVRDEKPQDFEMSEQVVVTGAFQGEEFIASDLLLKCPSKYKDEELQLKNQG